jgi:4-amino-4-deoxy-L-arabinose transferase-like glycosyltransferase
MLLGLALRLGWLFSRSRVIENEGGEYAAIADNILSGVGYVGQGHLPEPQLFFPPVYPGAIALVSLILGNTELAGRVVSLCVGVALIPATFALATYMFGRRVGLVAAALVATHPLLVRLSTEVQSEATYFTLAFTIAYVAIRAFESKRIRDFLLGGTLCGLAYLTRPEAMLLMPVLAATGLVAAVQDRQRPGRLVFGLASCFAAFFVVAAPYIAYLYANTGVLRFETKSIINLVIDSNMLRGEDLIQAHYGISPSLQEYGAFMGDLDQRIVDEASGQSIIDVLKIVPSTAPEQVRHLAGTVRTDAFGGVPLVILGTLGFLAGRRCRQRTRVQVLLAAMLLVSTVSLFSLKFFYPRYAYIFLPFLLLWAANALNWLDAELHYAIHAFPWLRWLPRRLPVEHGLVTVIAAGVVLLAGLATLAAGFDDWGGSFHAAEQTREAGMWLVRQDPDRKTIMDAGSAVPYYAKAGYIPLPYAAEDVALRYIDSKDPDYVVVRGELGLTRPYLDDWAREGIPNAGDRLVYDTGGPPSERIRIYRWRIS